jgi:hypothetical protein
MVNQPFKVNFVLRQKYGFQPQNRDPGNRLIGFA